MRFLPLLALFLAACGKLFANSSAPTAKPQPMPPTSSGSKLNPASRAEDATCALAATPKTALSTRTVMTCNWKSSCLDGGWIRLGHNINVTTIKITSQSDGKIYEGSYDEGSGNLSFAPKSCPRRGSTFVLQFELVNPKISGESSQASGSAEPIITLTAVTLDHADSVEKLTLYANPCIRHITTVTSCEAGAPLIDIDSEIPSCASLNLELGDSCPAGLEKC